MYIIRTKEKRASRHHDNTSPQDTTVSQLFPIFNQFKLGRNNLNQHNEGDGLIVDFPSHQLRSSSNYYGQRQQQGQQHTVDVPTDADNAATAGGGSVGMCLPTTVGGGGGGGGGGEISAVTAVAAGLLRGNDQLQPTSPKRKPRRNAREVQFSEDAELKIFERIDDVLHSAVWYNSKEYTAMRTATKRVALEMQKRILMAPSGGEPDVVASSAMTGIESILSPKTTKKNRVGYWRAVFEEQARQYDSNEYDPDRIASSAKRHTQIAARRARTIGKLHSM